MTSRHPSEADLALLAGGDCGWLRGLLLNRHVTRCGDCRDIVASFCDMRSAVQEFAAPDFVSNDRDWEGIAAEMRANIRVGLAAGECVREVPVKSSQWGWKLQVTAGMAGVVLLAGAGLFLRGLLPHENSAGIVPSAVLESTGAGVEVRTDTGSSMTLLNHGDAAVDETVTSQGAIRARYVDGNTGTVTVTSVYVE